MSRTSRSFFKACAFALSLAVLGLLTSAAHAALINYGNFGPAPPGVSFLQVTESSGSDPVPLYGAPTAFTTGLRFLPIGFVATSSGGGADITDGQLNLTLQGNVNLPNAVAINSVTVFEAGDYTKAGTGTPATSLFAGAIIRATVTEINGASVAPINLDPVNGSVNFALPGAAVAEPWSLGVTIDIAAQMAAKGFGPAQRPTKVDLAINNSLVATSEANSVAFIAKKEFRVDVAGSPYIVPEPGALSLAGLALCGLGLVGRKRD
jgi:hypothetical protein